MLLEPDTYRTPATTATTATTPPRRLPPQWVRRLYRRVALWLLARTTQTFCQVDGMQMHLDQAVLAVRGDSLLLMSNSYLGPSEVGAGEAFLVVHG